MMTIRLRIRIYAYTYAIIFRALGMSKYLGDDVHTLFVSQNTTCHRTTDKFPIVHKEISHAEPNVVREHEPLVDRDRFDTLSSTFSRGPPVQRGK